MKWMVFVGLLLTLIAAGCARSSELGKGESIADQVYRLASPQIGQNTEDVLPRVVAAGKSNPDWEIRGGPAGSEGMMRVYQYEFADGSALVLRAKIVGVNQGLELSDVETER